MYHFSKHFHPENFAYPSAAKSSKFDINNESFEYTVNASEQDIYLVEIKNKKKWPKEHVRSELSLPEDMAVGTRGSQSSLDVRAGCGITLKNKKGEVLLESLPQSQFGVSGKAWLFQFVQQAAMQFYGLGEKSVEGFERSGRTYKFWNTDACGDWPRSIIDQGIYDPDYISIPYTIVKQNNTYVGILINNPYASTVSLRPRNSIANQMDLGVAKEGIWLGAEDGVPSIVILYGPTLADLTKKFQLLSGRSALPPIWALGHQQCRWGYKNPHDLNQLADMFEKHKFPNDGLWLDIDYMHGYRVFTFEKKHFSDPKKEIGEIVDRGYKVVPIIDPGVKQEPGYAVYDDGKKNDIFCRNAAGGDFMGFVWPGRTLFPDFTLAGCQTWWAKKCADFASKNIYGAWLDMNDPATATVDPTGMLFNKGSVAHDAYHSQYAFLMARATRLGFLQARPDTRPFLVSRSGSTGSQKWAANWTGDNTSNYIHMRLSIAKTLNLALSGMPFNGPDVGGFSHSTSEPLLVDWYKAGYLFPFFRNHTDYGSRRQEPWAFSQKALEVIRYYVRLRYKLMPYFYNLFVENEISGEAILRPLMYDFADTPKLPLGTIDDQLMVGSSIMQAPFLYEEKSTREIVLPDCQWYRGDTGEWVKGGKKISATKEPKTTPLFFREGAIVPMLKGTPVSNKKDLRNVELFLFFRPKSKIENSYIYRCDDGESFAYTEGKRSEYSIEVESSGTTLVVEIDAVSEAFGTVAFLPVTVKPFTKVIYSLNGVLTELYCVEKIQDYFGKKIAVYEWHEAK